MAVSIIGIAGGSGSGKTTIADAIVANMGSERVQIISHDRYYAGWNHLSYEDRAAINFDHPDSLDTELLCDHLDQLRSGHVVNVPIYDFTTHQRLDQTDPIEPRNIIVVEGVLALVDPLLREKMDFRIFVDTDDDLRLVRRISRDIHERGRSLESVIDQYLSTVRPMYLEFVAPSRRYADIIVPEGGHNALAITMICNHIEALAARE